MSYNFFSTFHKSVKFAPMADLWALRTAPFSSGASTKWQTHNLLGLRREVCLSWYLPFLTILVSQKFYIILYFRLADCRATGFLNRHSVLQLLSNDSVQLDGRKQTPDILRTRFRLVNLHVFAPCNFVGIERTLLLLLKTEAWSSRSKVKVKVLS